MSQIARMAIVLGGSVNGFTAAMKTARQQVDGFIVHVESAASRLTSRITSLLGIGGGLAGIFGLGTGIKAAAEFEQAEVAMTTMLGSAKEAKVVLDGLYKFAADTPFEFPELRESATKLLAFGTGSNELIPTLRMIGDISSGIGQPLGEIAEIYGKARTQGRLFADDIRQLGGRGIPIIQELARQFNVTESAVGGLVTNGQVTFANLQLAFTNMTGEGGKFAGMMQNQSTTLTGLFSTLKDTVTMGLRTIAQALLNGLNVKQGMKELTMWVQDFARKVGVVVQILIKWTGEHWEQIKVFTKWSLIISFAGGSIMKLIKWISTLVAAYGTLSKATAVLQALQGPKGWAFLAAGAAAAALAVGVISEKFGSLSDEFTRLSQSASESADAINATWNQQTDASMRRSAKDHVAAQKQQELATAISAVRDKLKDSIATFGMSTTAIEIWKLKQDGATRAQLEQVEAIASSLEALQEHKKFMDEMQQQAKQIVSESMSPQQKMNEKLDLIDTLERMKLLTPEQAAQAAEHAADQYARTFDRKKKRIEFKHMTSEKTAALERRITTGFMKNDDKLLKAAQRGAKAQERAAASLDDIRRNLNFQVVEV